MDRQRAHLLLDQLGPRKFTAVAQLLEVLASSEGAAPLNHSLALASVEEEQITPETAEALARARSSLARGKGIAHTEIMREFGLTR